MRCFACGGPYHPATGHLFREFMVAYCGRCYRHFIEWMKGHMRRKWGGLDFYAEAAKRPRSSNGSECDAPNVEVAGSSPAEDTNQTRSRRLTRLRTPPSHGGNVGFKSPRDHHPVPSSNGQGHRPFKPRMRGSSPPGITSRPRRLMEQGTRLRIESVGVRVLSRVPKYVLVRETEYHTGLRNRSSQFESGRGHQGARA